MPVVILVLALIVLYLGATNKAYPIVKILFTDSKTVSSKKNNR